MDLLELPDEATLGRLYAGFFDDFVGYTSGQRWTSILTDSGTAAVQNEQNGVLLLTASDGTVADNDEAYAYTTAELFKQVSGCPIILEARVKFTEANTDDANVMIGLLDGAAANSILDNGAGPPASYNGGVFFKVDGATVWNVENSDGATQKTTTLDGTHEKIIGSPIDGASQTAGGSWQRLRIGWFPKSSTKADWLFWINGAPVAKHTDQPYASATEMAVFLGVKNGGANLETLRVDYVFCYQKRE